MSIAKERVSTIVNQSPTQSQLWYGAIKPPMYTVAIIPISFATALAYWETNLFNPVIYFTFLLSAILIIAWLNLTNDVFDADTGIDVHKAHSIVNLTGKKNLIFIIANIFLLMGLVGIILINYWQQDGTVLMIMLACCLLGYSYQGPPFRLGYLGLGEIICFFTFGPMTIEAVYYSQTQTFSLNSLWASILIGISTSIILFCSHFHQVKDDMAAGKKSPVVRLGSKTAAQLLIFAVISFYSACFLLIWSHILPLTTGIIILSLPIAVKLSKLIDRNHDQPEQVKNSKFMAVNLHFVSGLLLCLGCLLPY